MTDSRRTFLQRFSASAVAMGSGGAAGLLVGCVYGPPPPPEQHDSPFRQDLEEYKASVGSLLPFGRDSIVLSSDSKARLDRQIAWLKAHPVFDIQIEGHTGDPGSPEYLLALSMRMAEAVRTQMIAQGILAERITLAGFGDKRPLVQGDDRAARDRNRRVEVRPRLRSEP